MSAAEQAERLSVSVSLDPDLERDELEPLVDRYTRARRDGKPKVAKAAENKIDALLRAEVVRRLDLTFAAIETLRADRRPLNEGAVEVGAGIHKGAGRWDYLRLEEQLVADGEGNGHFPPSPETDKNRRTGAARYHRSSSAEEEVEGALIHHDEELQEDAVANGDAIRGQIVKVEDRAPADSKAVIPVWTVESSSATPTRMRRGSSVCVAGMPSRDGTVLDVHEKAGVRRFEIEIEGWKRRPNATRHPQFADVPPAADPSWRSRTSCCSPPRWAAWGRGRASGSAWETVRARG